MSLVRADAIDLPLADDSVDLIVTSPPYFALRSYTDGGEHYDGQIGAEDTPRAFLEALWAVTAECKRVLKPTGSIFVNLGDKYAGSGGHNNAGISDKSTLSGNGHDGGGPKIKATRRSSPDRYNQTADVRAKSLMGLPWLYALGCTGALAGMGGADPELDLILRAEIVWSKRNGMPESVRDRVRRSHEQWFHFTKAPDYFAALDEIREPHAEGTAQRYETGYGDRSATNGERQSTGYDLGGDWQLNARGKVPGSVWEMSSEPLQVPAHLDVDHFAAFPTEWPRRFVLGWSPTGICTACDQARVPVTETNRDAVDYDTAAKRAAERVAATGGRVSGGTERSTLGSTTTTTITGYACACPDDTAPTRPAVVLDPFGGTGTTAMVANALGRYGISVDLSADYLRLARWRIHESGHARKAIARTWTERQGALL